MKTEIVMVVDKSGSMATLANDTIGGFNKFLEDQIKNEISANISVMFFDSEAAWWQTDVPLNKAKKLNKDNYNTTGSTSLNDAIGKAYHVLEHKNPKQAVVVIITDGEENSSKVVQPTAVKAMLEDMQKRDWRVVYLAANQDAFKVGRQLGIDSKFTATIANTSKGIAGAYFAASNTVANYASGGVKGDSASIQSLVDTFGK